MATDKARNASKATKQLFSLFLKKTKTYFLHFYGGFYWS